MKERSIYLERGLQTKLKFQTNVITSRLVTENFVSLHSHAGNDRGDAACEKAYPMERVGVGELVAMSGVPPSIRLPHHICNVLFINYGT